MVFLSRSAQGTSSQNSLVLEEEMPKIPMTLDLNEDLFWETEVKNAIRENVAQERKLYFALAKREIVNENMKNLQIAKDDYEIQINKSVAKLAAKKRQSKKFLSPFIKFYLEVYRELCHKYPVQQIAAEASARWWRKSLKQKSKFQK